MFEMLVQKDDGDWHWPDRRSLPLRGLLAGKPPLAALGQGEAAVAQLLQNGDAGRRVAPLTVAYRPSHHQVGKSVSGRSHRRRGNEGRTWAQ